MADYDTVRRLTGDRTKAVTRELITNNSDALQRVYQLNMYPLVSATTANTIIWFSGKATHTASVTYSASVGRFTLVNPGATATAGSELRVDYKYHALSSGDISDMLSGHTGYPFLAAANACAILAADASRLFMYTMGDKTVDKRQVAKNLFDLSESLEKKHYDMLKSGNYKASVMTFKDDTGTPYHGYDTAVSYLE